MAVNGTMMQYFEWDLPDDGKHWQRLKEEAPKLSEIGITAVWIPPATKGTGTNDVGYGAYDLYDLGEFDQSGTVRTKYGTKEELHEAIQACHEHGIDVYADVVLNHKAHADHPERFKAVPVAEDDRNKEIGPVREIEGWTGFDFPGRNNKYSDFNWHWYHFTGVDYDNLTGESGVFQIKGDGKDWAPDDAVDSEHGNYDYLMYADIDYAHPEVIEETKKWVKWFIEETQIDGIRIDAAKHIDENFIDELIDFIRGEFGNDFFFVAEYWDGEYNNLISFMDEQGYDTHVFDTLLHFNFKEISDGTADVDARKLIDGSLQMSNPTLAVTFVDNHDTQPGQALESFIGDWFKPIAYGIILLSSYGYPCVFYGDYYGMGGQPPVEGLPEMIEKLLYLRKNHAYGRQDGYLDHHTVIGFTRMGNEEHPEPMAVLLSNGDAGEKSMYVGKDHAGREFYDYLGHHDHTVTVDEEGSAVFETKAGSISAWIPVSN